MANGGRTSKLTPDVQKKIAAAVRDGTPFKFAALAAGVSARSLMRWMAAGRKGKSREVVALLAAVKKAEAESIADSVKVIRKAGSKNWTARSWLLERRHPEHFALNRNELKEALKLLKSQSEELASIKARLGNLNPDTPKSEANRAGDAGGQRTGEHPPA